MAKDNVTVTTIRDLRTAIKEYRAELERLVPGTDEYKEKLGQLTSSTIQLNEINKEIRDSIKRVDDQQKNSVTTIKTLRTEILQYRNILAREEEGTERYSEALRQLADRQSKLNSINRDVQASTQNLTDLYSRLSQTAAGVVGGFTALQGVVSSLGGDTDDLAQALIKVQTAMSIVQGFTALSSAVKAANLAFKGLNATLAANPLGAAVIAVAALTAGITAIVKSFSKQTTEVDKGAQAYDRYTTALKSAQEEQEYQLRLLRASGATQEEIHNKRIEFINEEIKQTQIWLKHYYDNLAFLNDDQLKRLEEFQKMLAQQQASIKKTNDDYNIYLVEQETKAAQDSVKRAEEAAKKQREARKKAQEEEERQIEAFNKATADLQRQRNEQAIALQRELLQDEALTDFVKAQISLVESSIEEYNRIINTSTNIKEREEATRSLIEAEREQLSLMGELNTLEEKRASQQKEIANLEKEAQIIRQDAAIQQIEDEEQRQSTVLEGLRLSLEVYEQEMEILFSRLETETLTNEQRISLLEQYNTALRNSNKVAQEIAKAEDVIQKNKLKSQQQLFKATTQILQESSKVLGEETAAGKAVAIAGATIDTYRAATSAYAATPGGPIVKALASAATIATGLTSVKKIIETKIPGTSDKATTNTESVSLPSFPEIYEPIQETHNNLNRYDEEILNQYQKVYVLESDITNTQHRVEVSEKTAFT